MNKPGGDKLRFTFAGSIYFNRMKELGFYSTDKSLLPDRVFQQPYISPVLITQNYPFIKLNINNITFYYNKYKIFCQ